MTSTEKLLRATGCGQLAEVVAVMSEAEIWLLANAHIGPNTRAARLALEALRSRERANNEAVSWLAEVAFGEGSKAGLAAEILREVA